MRRFIYNIIPLVSICIILLQSCKKETTGGFTQITVYPVITLEGGKIYFVKAGIPYKEPGVKATLDGVDVTKDLIIKSTVNTAKVGKYSVSYSMTNSDGFKVEDSRTVYVYDGTASSLESKVYTVATGTNRNGTTAYSGYPIAVYQISPGVFSISDFLGGYYDKRAGYGSAYAAVGSFKLNGDNSLTLLNSSVAGWGDELSGLANANYDKASGTLSFTSQYAGFNFNVILK